MAVVFGVFVEFAVGVEQDRDGRLVGAGGGDGLGAAWFERVALASAQDGFWGAVFAGEAEGVGGDGSGADVADGDDDAAVVVEEGVEDGDVGDVAGGGFEGYGEGVVGVVDVVVGFEDDEEFGGFLDGDGEGDGDDLTDGEGIGLLVAVDLRAGFGAEDDDGDGDAGAVDGAGVDDGDFEAAVARGGGGDDAEVGAADAGFGGREGLGAEVGGCAVFGLDEAEVDVVVEALAGGGEGDDFELVPAVAVEVVLDAADEVDEFAVGGEGADALPDLAGGAEVAAVVDGGDVEGDAGEGAGAARADFELDFAASAEFDFALVCGGEDAGVGGGDGGGVLLLRLFGRAGGGCGRAREFDDGDGEAAGGDVAGGGDGADFDVGRAERGGGPFERGGVDALVVEECFGGGGFGAVDGDGEAGDGFVALGGGAEADGSAEVDVLEGFDADDGEAERGVDEGGVVGDVDADEVVGCGVGVVDEGDAEVGAAEAGGGPGEAGDVDAARFGEEGGVVADGEAVDEEACCGDRVGAAGFDADEDALVEEDGVAVLEGGGDDGCGVAAVFIDVPDEGPGEEADEEDAGEEEEGDDGGAADRAAGRGSGLVARKGTSQGPALLHRGPAAGCARSRRG